MIIHILCRLLCAFLKKGGGTFCSAYVQWSLLKILFGGRPVDPRGTGRSPHISTRIRAGYALATRQWQAPSLNFVFLLYILSRFARPGGVTNLHHSCWILQLPLPLYMGFVLVPGTGNYLSLNFKY